MAYTPTSWTTGDTITATKLNKIEQGIANAGGGGDYGGSGFYVLTTTNYPNSSNTVGWFRYAKKTGSTYAYVQFPFSGVPSITVYGNGTVAHWPTIPIPTIDDYYLVFCPNSGSTIASSSGGIATTPVTVSGMNANYIVTGDFTVTLSGWA